MKKRFFKRVASIAIALTLVLGLFAVSEINVYAEEELPTGLEKPIVEYKEVTEEEFNKAIAESKSASENVYNEYVYGESAYKGTDSFWSQFSKPYYDYSFSRLSDSQKSLYYNLYQELYSMIEGGVNLTDNALDDKGKRHYLTNPVFCSGLSEDDAMEVAYLIAYNAPEFYFVSQYISIVHDGRTGRYGVRMGVYDGMQSGSSRAYYASLIKSKINWYLNQVSTSLSAYDKEKKIHDLLIDNCHYGSSNTSYSQSCASAFLNPGGETVCAGYSEAFALLCYARGIPVISITSSDHEWSQVQLGNYWYAVDVTHDDAKGSRYRYFNKSDNTMRTLGRAAHTIEGFWSSVGRESCPYDYGSEPASGGTTWYNGVNYSNVYDYNYYINTYADLKAAFGSNPSGAIEHFVNCGMNEGRQAKSTFNVVSYRNQWSDLRQTFGWNNLPAYYRHYNDCGAREGRTATGCNTVQNPLHHFLGVDISPIYNYQYYINNNPDVRKAFGGDDTATFIHFLTCGMNEGRKSCENFDVYSYRNQWSDLRQAFGWNNLKEYYIHYSNCGRYEGRAGTGCNSLQNPVHVFWGYDYSPVYNYEYYKSHNADLRKAFGDNDMDYFVHFLTCGMKEGRQGNSGFDVYKYAGNYPDLFRSFWFNLPDYYIHYIVWGRTEGRKC